MVGECSQKSPNYPNCSPDVYFLWKTWNFLWTADLSTPNLLPSIIGLIIEKLDIFGYLKSPPSLNNWNLLSSYHWIFSLRTQTFLWTSELATSNYFPRIRLPHGKLRHLMWTLDLATSNHLPSPKNWSPQEKIRHFVCGIQIWLP